MSSTTSKTAPAPEIVWPKTASIKVKVWIDGEEWNILDAGFSIRAQRGFGSAPRSILFDRKSTRVPDYDDLRARVEAWALDGGTH